MIFLAVVLLLILSFVAFLISEKGRGTKNFLKFLVTGLDTGFSLRQIALLGKVGKSAGLDDVSSLYWSLPSLDRCTAEIIRQSKLNGTENNPETQKVLTHWQKLGQFRRNHAAVGAGKHQMVSNSPYWFTRTIKTIKF